MCSQCPLGMGTLPGIAAVSADNCTIAKGYGFYAGGIQPCPLGTYNDEVRPNTTAPCTPCPPGQWSSVEGGQGARDCDVCMPGWGEAACATQCGAANGANYGSAGRARGSRCDPCPVLDVGWSFDFKGTRDVFTPRTVARAGATTRSGCLAEFLQVRACCAWPLVCESCITCKLGGRRHAPTLLLLLAPWTCSMLPAAERARLAGWRQRQHDACARRCQLCGVRGCVQCRRQLPGAAV
jgi:hypothetical protein